MQHVLGAVGVVGDAELLEEELQQIAAPPGRKAFAERIEHRDVLRLPRVGLGEDREPHLLRGGDRLARGEHAQQPDARLAAERAGLDQRPGRVAPLLPLRLVEKTRPREQALPRDHPHGRRRVGLERLEDRARSPRMPGKRVRLTSPRPRSIQSLRGEEFFVDAGEVGDHLVGIVPRGGRAWRRCAVAGAGGGGDGCSGDGQTSSRRASFPSQQRHQQRAARDHRNRRIRASAAFSRL